jgi:hypothetical protein
MKKPIKTKTIGQFDFRLVQPETWAESVADLESRIPGVKLPTIKQLGTSDRIDWWVLLNPLIIMVEFEDGKILELDLAPGYMTDFASVPPFLRSIMHNTRHELRLAALVHDCLYARKLMGWAEANRVFRDMILLAGGARGMANLAWLAVSTPVGWRCYKTTEKWEVELHNQTVALTVTE